MRNKKKGVRMPIGQKIRDLRQAAGLTQKELAVAVGMSEPAIRNFELGNREPKQKHLEKIAMALQVDPAALGIPSNPDTPFGAMHAFFKMQETFGLHPEVLDGQICLVPEKEGKPSDITYDVMKWHEQEELADAGEISGEELQSWKDSFPRKLVEEQKKNADPKTGAYSVDIYGDIKAHVERHEAKGK